MDPSLECRGHFVRRKGQLPWGLDGLAHVDQEDVDKEVENGAIADCPSRMS